MNTWNKYTHTRTHSKGGGLGGIPRGRCASSTTRVTRESATVMLLVMIAGPQRTSPRSPSSSPSSPCPPADDGSASERWTMRPHGSRRPHKHKHKHTDRTARDRHGQTGSTGQTGSAGKLEAGDGRSWTTVQQSGALTARACTAMSGVNMDPTVTRSALVHLPACKLSLQAAPGQRAAPRNPA